MESKVKNQPAHLSKKEIRDNKISQLKQKYGEDLVNLVAILKQNAEIRRFTSKLFIEKYCKINKEAEKATSKFIKFHSDKFAIIVDGIATEFRYNNEMFIISLIDAFAEFANYAQHIINKFTENEMKQTINEIYDKNSENKTKIEK